MRFVLALTLASIALASCGLPVQQRRGEGEGEGEGEEGEGEGEIGPDFACDLEIASVNEVEPTAGTVALVQPGDDVRVRLRSRDVAITSAQWSVDGPGIAGISDPTSIDAHVSVNSVGAYVVYVEATKPDRPNSLCALQFVAGIYHDVSVDVSWDQPDSALGIRATRAATGALVSAEPDGIAFTLLADTDVAIEWLAGTTTTTATARVFIDGALENEVSVVLDGTTALTPVFAMTVLEGVYCVDDATDPIDACALD